MYNYLFVVVFVYTHAHFPFLCAHTVHCTIKQVRLSRTVDDGDAAMARRGADIVAEIARPSMDRPDCANILATYLFRCMDV